MIAERTNQSPAEIMEPNRSESLGLPSRPTKASRADACVTGPPTPPTATQGADTVPSPVSRLPGPREPSLDGRSSSGLVSRRFEPPGGGAGRGSGTAVATGSPSSSIPPPPPPQPPGHQHSQPLFFYGSLMDSEVLQIILQLPDSPVMEKASIRGYRVKMWGIFPTLLPDPDGRVEGMAWVSTGWEDLIRLQRYETEKFRPAECEVRYPHPSGRDEDALVVKGITFVWRGDPDSSELLEGEFDFDFYQINIKPEVFRPTAKSMQW